MELTKQFVISIKGLFSLSTIHIVAQYMEFFIHQMKLWTFEGSCLYPFVQYDCFSNPVLSGAIQYDVLKYVPRVNTNRSGSAWNYFPDQRDSDCNQLFQVNPKVTFIRMMEKGRKLNREIQSGKEKNSAYCTPCQFSGIWFIHKNLLLTFKMKV